MPSKPMSKPYVSISPKFDIRKIKLINTNERYGVIRSIPRRREPPRDPEPPAEISESPIMTDDSRLNGEVNGPKTETSINDDSIPGLYYEFRNEINIYIVNLFNTDSNPAYIKTEEEEIIIPPAVEDTKIKFETE